MTNFTYDITDGNVSFEGLDGSDTLTITGGVIDRNFSFLRENDDLLVYTEAGTTIRLTNHFASNTSRIETINVAGSGTIDLSFNSVKVGTVDDQGILGDSSSNLILGGVGNNTHINNNGGNNHSLNNGIDMIYAGSGNDSANGGAGNDILYGGNGDDNLNGGDGNDIIYGGNGDDVLLSGKGNDTIFGEDGNDVISINGDTIIDHGFSYVDGGAGNDTIYGDAREDTFLGGSGDDHLDGGMGDDILYGGEGNDYLYAGANVGVVPAAFAQFDILYGEEGNDYLEFSNQLDGELYGGSGNDTYKLFTPNSRGYEFNIFDDSGENDTLILGKQTSTSFSRVGNDLNIYMLDGNQYGDIIVQDHFSVGHHIENLEFLNPANTYLNLVEYLTPNNDDYDGTSLTSGAGLDDNIIHALEGDDFVRGNSGDDIIYGDEGDDRLQGGSGNDILIGGDGLDTADYSDATSAVSVNIQTGAVSDGHGGSDTLIEIENIIGSDFNDLLVGNNTYDNTIWGGNGNDNIQGRAGDDVLYGDAGADQLRGADGNDTLYGGDGNDQLYGNNGDDILSGQDGLDALWGYAGADTFVFEVANAYNHSDNVKDFNLTDGDMLDLSDLLGGYDPINDLITDFVQITDNGTHSYVSVDADGGADNFQQVAQLSSITGLTDEQALESNGTLITA